MKHYGWIMRNKGFTLIEILVVLTLFFIVLSSTFLLLQSTSRFWQKFCDKMASFEVVTSVSNVISNDIREAKLVSAEAAGQRLVLIDIDNNSIQYELISGRIRRRKGGSSSYLTYDEYVDQLFFSNSGEGMISFEVWTSSVEVFSRLARSRNYE